MRNLAPTESAPVLTIAEFCQQHSISRGFFNALRARGEGPDLIQLGRRVLISSEAAADWRARHTVRTVKL